MSLYKNDIPAVDCNWSVGFKIHHLFGKHRHGLWVKRNAMIRPGRVVHLSYLEKCV